MAISAKMPAAEDFFKSDGQGLSTAGVHYLQSLEKIVRKVNTLSDDDAFEDELNGQFKYPEAGTEIIVASAKYARKIPEISAYSLAGTITLTWKINGTDLGGDPNSVTTSVSTEAHTADNEIAVGDTLTCVLSSVSSDCVGVGWTIKHERPLA